MPDVVIKTFIGRAGSSERVLNSQFSQSRKQENLLRERIVTLRKERMLCGRIEEISMV